MSRPKRNIRIPESYIKDIQHWADCEATLKKMYEKFLIRKYNPIFNNYKLRKRYNKNGTSR